MVLTHQHMHHDLLLKTPRIAVHDLTQWNHPTGRSHFECRMIAEISENSA